MSGLTHRRSRAFTLVELLVVIGIVALLVSILLPTLARARDSAKAVKCASNARQIVTSLIGYSSDHLGSLPIGYSPIGFEPVPTGIGITGDTILPGARRTMEGWVFAAAGWSNVSRANGYNLPWTTQAVVYTDANDNYPPIMYCPHVLQDFDQQWTHYGINQTLMPCWWFSNHPSLGNLLAKTHKPFNMANVYGDNAILWDGQQQRFAAIATHRGSGIYLFPSFAFQGIDFSQTSYWPIPDRDWDMLYRNDEGEDPSMFGDPWRSSEFSVMVNLPNLGLYWYGTQFEYFRGQEDLLVQPFGGVTYFETDLAYAPIMRHNGKSRCNTGFVDGSVRGMTYNPRELHPALPGGPYAVGDIRRTHIRPKWPSQLPQSK